MKHPIAALMLLTSTLVAVPAMADRDFDHPPGHRARPYDRSRHYDRYDYRGRDYRYRGHWRSWHDWDGYYRAHPWLHHHGHYYHDDGHLMFRYCDPDSDGCFFFSIGR